MGGPGYASPQDAMVNGEREKLLYVITVQPNLEEEHGDYLSTVDVDPDSKTYCKVIYRTFTHSTGNELHHSGWNTCSSCFKCNKKTAAKRTKLVLPALTSERIFVVDVGKDMRAPKMHKVIESDVMSRNNCSAPHTSHCLANGNIMISTMGDKDGKAKGDFILFNQNFECIGTWTKPNNNEEPGESDRTHLAKCGYDFWYQPYFNIMIASEWAAPNLFRRGFDISDTADESQFGRRLNFYDWEKQTLIQTIDLGENGLAPLEVRFLHNPKESQGFVGCAVTSNVFRFYKKENSNEYAVEEVIKVQPVKVNNWALPILPGLISDILISLDDKYLYFSNWLQGDIRQYDITDTSNPRLVGQIFLGGVLVNDETVTVAEDNDNDGPASQRKRPTVVKNTRLYGGPQMLQLSLDGKRLYVTSSLFLPWDKQFYPKMVNQGGTIVQIDVDVENGGLKINENFLVDFGNGNEPYGPTLPHEMRYPGGDCTSDIWLA